MDTTESKTEYPEVSFVVITMNRRDDVRRCLDNISQQDCQPGEIILVDNASSDGTARMVQEEFPHVRIIESETNLGVSGGRNVGIQAAKGEICICLDDDAEFSSRSATKRIVEYFQNDAKLACLALTIIDPTTGTEDRKAIPRRDKKSLPNDYETTYFCGAGFAVRRGVFLELGMFWEPFIYGAQELDLSYRFLDHGYRLLHTKQVTVLHHETAAARPRGQYFYFNTRDRPWLAIRHLPLRYVATTIVLWWLQLGATSLRHRRVLAYLKGILASIAGIPKAVATRRRIGRAALRSLHHMSGRTWY